jgi:hypothetical protein
MPSEQRLKLAVNQAVRHRNYRRARERALTRLAQAYPDLYKAYLEEEKQNDKTQGKTWIDLDGNTIGVQFPESLNAPAEREPDNYYEDEGN